MPFFVDSFVVDPAAMLYQIIKKLMVKGNITLKVLEIGYHTCTWIVNQSRHINYINIQWEAKGATNNRHIFNNSSAIKSTCISSA